MNKKGFTLVELLATLVILGIVTGIVLISVSGYFKNAKSKTEDVFIDTIKDVMEVYLNTGHSKSLSFNGLVDNSGKSCYLDKTSGFVRVYVAETNFDSVISAEYNTITKNELKNPANEDVSCGEPSDIDVTIYKDDDSVYYYSIDKGEFGTGGNSCLISEGVISNLPGEFVCE